MLTMSSTVPPRHLRAGITVPSGKWTDGNGDGDADPGEIISYSLIITNTGSVSLYNLKVASDTIGAESIECPTFPDSGVAPGVTVTCSAEYEVNEK